MILLLLLTLGSEDWHAREAAERALSAFASDSVCRTWNPDNPEVHARLERILRRVISRELNSLLPASHPYWPDVDYTGWPRPEVDKEYKPYLWKFEYGTFAGGIHYFSRMPIYDMFRQRTRSCIFYYILATGDWAGAREETIRICNLEETQWPNANKPLIWWTLKWLHPTLAK